MRKRGFTLLELLISAAIMALIGAVGVITTRQASNRGEVRGVAELVAEEIRAARQRAISQQVPVAVCLPSGNGSRAHSRGLYVMEGDFKPRVTQTVDYSKEYSQTCLFVGLWPTAGAITRTDPRNGSSTPTFNFTNWQAPYPNDPMLIFTPSGSVKSNGMPVFNGHYHILVSEGVEYASTGAPAGSGTPVLSYYALSRAAMPHTVTVSPAGAVAVSRGIEGNTGGVSIAEGPLSVAGAPANPKVWTAGGNNPPVVVGVVPDPVQQAPYRIAPDGTITIRLYATDADGDVLYSSWSASGPKGAGRWSSPTEGRMQWLPTGVNGGAGGWVSTWTWSAPENAQPGESYRLTYNVNDGRGGVQAGDLGSSGSFLQVSNDGKICFDHYSKSGSYEIAVANPNSTGTLIVTRNDDDCEHTTARFAPTGSQLACYGYDINTWDSEMIFLTNVDGSNLNAIYTSQYGFDWSGPAWTPDGTQIVLGEYVDPDYEVSRIVRIDANGSNRTPLTSVSSPLYDWAPVCSTHPIDGAVRVAFVREKWTNSGVGDKSVVMAMRLDGTGEQAVSANVTDEYYYDPSFSRNGDRLVFTGENKLWLTDWDNSLNQFKPPVAIGSGYNAYNPQISPDGTKIAFIDGSDTLCITNIDGSHPDTGVANGRKRLVQDAWYYWWSPASDQIVWDDGWTLFMSNVGGAVTTKRFSMKDAEEDWIPHWWGR